MGDIFEIKKNFKNRLRMPVEHITNEDTYKETLKSGVVLVDFYATWCGPCKRISPVLEELSNNEAYASVKFVKIDVDELEGVAAAAKISAMPTFHVYKDGEKAGEVVGASEEAIKELLAKFK